MFAGIARDCGLDVRELAKDWSRPVSPEEILSAIRRQPEIRGVLVVHSETSTGVLNDVRSIAESIGSDGPVLIVDAMSSLGSVPLDMRWGLDAVVSCSQKGLMCPPGVAVVATSERYQTQSISSRLTKSYWDFRRQAASLEKSPPETHNTAAVPVIVAMAAALDLLADLGFDTAYARTAMMAGRVRRAVAAMGLHTATEGLDTRYCSPTVTTVICPEGVDVPSLLRHVRENSNVMFARGLGHLAERTFRLGHMGAVSDRHLVRGLEAVDQGLAAFGWSTDGAWRCVFDQQEVKAHE
jgi:aspartate aminotransferase-like enzyme